MLTWRPEENLLFSGKKDQIFSSFLFLAFHRKAIGCFSVKPLVSVRDKQEGESFLCFINGGFVALVKGRDSRELHSSENHKQEHNGNGGQEENRTHDTSR